MLTAQAAMRATVSREAKDWTVMRALAQGATYQMGDMSTFSVVISSGACAGVPQGRCTIPSLRSWDDDCGMRRASWRADADGG